MNLGYLVIESFIVIFAVFLYNEFHKRIINKMAASSMKKLLIFMVVVLGLFAGCILIFDYIDSFYFFQSVSGKAKISDLVTIIVFPTIVTWISMIFKRSMSFENLVSAATVIITFSMLEYLFFHSLGIVRILWMAGMNCVTVCTMLFSIDSVKNEIDALAQIKWMIGYMIFWAGLILIFQERICYGFGTINGSLFERYDTFTAGIYIAVLLGFVQMITKYLGSNKKTLKRSYLIYQAAYVNLMLKSVLGFLYWIGILPFRVDLPFANAYGALTDAACIAFLILSEKENKNEIY